MFFMNRLLVLMCMIFAALGSATSHAEQKLQAAKSDIVFVSKQMGVPVEGRFKSFDAQISFDPAKPASGKISFSVDMASASLGAKETDAEVQKSDWFSTAKFAKAGFQSTAIKKTAPDNKNPIGSAQPNLPKPGFSPPPSKKPRPANMKSAANSLSKA